MQYAPSRLTFLAHGEFMLCIENGADSDSIPTLSAVATSPIR